MLMKIRDWYMNAYPTDDLGSELSNATFLDLFNALDAHKDVYEVLGEGDSLIRERCFEKLADLLGVSYDYVYDQWMNA